MSYGRRYRTTAQIAPRIVDDDALAVQRTIDARAMLP
jgi:hypothetical protein